MGIFDTIRGTVGDAVDEAEETAEDVQETVGDVVEGAQEAAGEVQEGAQEAAGEVQEGAQDVAEEVGQGDLGGAVDEASETAGELGDTASDTGGDVADTVTETSGNVVSGESDTGSDAFDGGGGGSSGGSGSGGNTGSGSRPPQNQSDNQVNQNVLNQLRGNTPGSGEGPSVQDRLNRTEAMDRDIVNEDFAQDGGSVFENPTNREITTALYGSGEASTFNEAFNQGMRQRNAQNVLQSDQAIEQAENRKEELSGTIENIQEGPTKQGRLEDLRSRKQEVESIYQDDTRYRIDPDTLSETQKEQLGYTDPENTTGDPSIVLTGEQIESRILQNTGLQDAITNLETSEGLYTVETTNAQGETVTRTVTQEEALNQLRDAQSSLDNQIGQFRDQAQSSLTNLFQSPEGSEGPSWGDQSLSEITGETRSGQSENTGTTQYRANPQAISRINELQDRLTNTVMGQDQREQIQNRIDELQTEARQPAELPGGTNIRGQSYLGTVSLPGSAQDELVSTGPSGPVDRFGRSVSDSFNQFASRPESRNVENVQLSNDLFTQVGAGLGTLASSEGYTYLASFVPGGRSPGDVAEERIQEDFQNPSTGPGRVGEAALSSPVGLAATAGAGALVGAGGKAASVIGSSGRVAQAARGAGALATGIYAGSQTGRVAALAQEGETTRAGGEALRTVGELGAFGKGYRAFQRYDAPVLGRTSVTQADNTLGQLDDGFTGAGRMEATTNFQRGPFSRNVLGLDDTGEVATNINYRIAGDEAQTNIRGTLTQEIPGNADDSVRELEGISRVVDRGDEGLETITRDTVRTREEGRLFNTYSDFTDTSVNRRVGRQPVTQLRRTDDEFVYQDTGERFVNPSQRETGVEAEIPADAEISRYESFSVADDSGIPPEETFGSSRTLIFRSSDEGAGGASGSFTEGGGGRAVTVQELGGYPAGGEPVSTRGLYSQARSAAREAVSPNLGGREYLSGGAGFGIVNTAEAEIQDGQRAVSQFGGNEVQNFQTQSDVSLQREQVQSRMFSQSGAQALEVEGAQRQYTAGGPRVIQRDQTQAEQADEDLTVIDVDRRIALTEAAREIQSLQPSTQETIRRPEPDYITPGMESPQRRDSIPGSTPGRVSRVRSGARGRFRSGETQGLSDQGLGLGVGQDQFQFEGVDQVQFEAQRPAQTQRVELGNLQRYRTRPVTATVSTPRPVGRARGRPGLPGLDFEGEVGFRGETRGSAQMIGRGEIDPTFDIISAQAVEATTEEQARFESRSEENIAGRQEDLGAFVRNKPVQAQNLEYGKSETGRREFF